MTKRLVDINDTLLAEATEALGAATMKETVARALQMVLQVRASRAHLEALASPVGADLRDPDVMSGAWR